MAADQGMPVSPDAAVDARVQTILEGQEFPALSRQIRQVMSLSEEDDASFRAVADTVLNDYALTLKVLRTVNSVHYNRSGTPILSVTRALLLLGTRTVRSLAASLLLLEHYERQSPALRQLMLLSMVSACQARELAVEIRYADPEEAYLCGMFRNLGEVLLASHFPEDYARVQAEMAERAEPGDVVVRRLGFRFEDLGAAVARYWGMRIVGEAMLPAGAGSTLRALTSLSHELTERIYRDPDPPRDKELRPLLDAYRAFVPLDPDRIGAVLDAASEESAATFRTLGVPAEELRLLDRRRRDEPPAEEAEPDLAPLRSQLEEEARAVLADPEAVDLNKALLVVLEAVQRGLPCDRVVLALVDAGRTELRGRFGLGEGIADLVTRFRFPLGVQAGSLARALQEPRVLLVPATSDRRPADTRIARGLGSDLFGVVPLVVRGKPVGCIWFDRTSAAPPPDGAAVEFLGRLRAEAERAFLRARQAPDPAATLTAEAKAGLVLRLLRGEAVEAVSAASGVAPEVLEQWKGEFLAGAIERLGGER